MAAEHRRDPDGEDGHTHSLPETERREREQEGHDDDGRHSGSPSLPETERRTRERERED